MKPSKINATSKRVVDQAAKERKKAGSRGPRAEEKLGIRELVAKPAFSGFVEASFLKGISLSMFVCENDDGVALRCLWNGVFEPFSIALWATLARDAQHVLDIGAHSGIYSLTAFAANPKAAVVSFEPFALNFGRLVLNLRANGFRCDLAANVALSKGEGVIPFTVATQPGYLTTGGQVGGQAGQQGSLFVTCATLDGIAASNKLRPGLMKIDVEGHELPVLEGGAQTLEQNTPDIILESVFNKDTAALEEMLKGLGYAFYIIQDDVFALEAVDHLRPSSTDSVNMDRLNRLVTKRSPEEVGELEDAARALLGSSR